MNQILQYLLIAGIVATTFGIVFQYAQNTLQVEMISQHDKVELEKKYAAEQLKLIDFINNPLRIDVMNVGLEPITIKKLFVDGVLDGNYTIHDGAGIQQIDDIPKNKITVIKPSLAGNAVNIITENNKNFSFE